MKKTFLRIKCVITKKHAFQKFRISIYDLKYNYEIYINIFLYRIPLSKIKRFFRHRRRL